MNLSFLYKNYEKIALTIVLIIFLLALMWLVNLFIKSEEERTTGIAIIANKTKYVQLPQSYYDFDTVLAKSQLWLPSSKRNFDKNDEFYIAVFTDFMKPFKIIRSPALKAEGKLIPYEYCKIGYCPVSKETISLPDTNILEKYTDTDADSIPDTIEKQLGMNPANASDANQDMDKDSFTNLQEYEYGKGSFVNDPGKHPPLIKRIILLNIAKAKIPITLKKIIRRNNNKKDWDIQINVNMGNEQKTLFLNIGSAIDLNNNEYKITDIIDRSYEILDPNLDAMLEYDNSFIILKDAKEKYIQVEINKPVYEQDKIAVVKDLYTKEIYKLRLKNIITLGNNISGTESYELSEIEDKENPDREVLIFVRKGKKYIVEKTTDYVPPESGSSKIKKKYLRTNN